MKMMEYVGEKGSVHCLEHFAFRRVNSALSLLPKSLGGKMSRGLRMFLAFDLCSFSLIAI